MPLHAVGVSKKDSSRYVERVQGRITREIPFLQLVHKLQVEKCLDGGNFQLVEHVVALRKDDAVRVLGQGGAHELGACQTLLLFLCAEARV